MMEPRNQAITSTRLAPRARAKQACGPCKIRKRRCNGQKPCGSCMQQDYPCHYGRQGHKRSKKVLAAPVTRERSSSSTPAFRSSNPQGRTPTEMNSGVIFPAEVAATLGDAKTLRTQGYCWNLGLRNVQIRSEKSVTWIITKDEWDILLQVYISKVHTIYGFVHLDDLLARTANRWLDVQMTNDFDHVISGVAALACLFSPDIVHDKESLLVACARELLERSLGSNPTHSDAQAWLLRTLYLRCSSTPHAAWMASCTNIHVIEAAGMNYDDTVPGHEDDPVWVAQVREHKRRTLWVAKLLNTWIGWEYGRSRSNLANPKHLPKRLPGDFTADSIDLFLLSEVLDPEKQSTAAELEEVLAKVAAMTFTVDALILSQSNFCFTAYRRLRLLNTTGQPSTIQKVIKIGQQGLQASLNASRSGSPWWHVSNVPFQFACILLAIDTRESLSNLHEAVKTLTTVSERFPTARVLQAKSTLAQLIQIAQRRREQDLIALQASIVDPDPWHGGSDTVPTADTISTSLSNDLSWTASSFEEIDWNQLWTGSFDFTSTTL